MRSHTQADADGNGKVSDTEFKNALLQSPGLSDDDIGKIYLSSKTTDDSTDEKAQTFNATYGPAGVTDYLYLQYLERAYHTAEANRKIAAGEGGNPDGSFNKSDLVNALNYMDLQQVCPLFLHSFNKKHCQPTTRPCAGTFTTPEYTFISHCQATATAPYSRA